MCDALKSFLPETKRGERSSYVPFPGQISGGRYKASYIVLVQTAHPSGSVAQVKRPSGSSLSIDILPKPLLGIHSLGTHNLLGKKNIRLFIYLSNNLS